MKFGEFLEILRNNCTKRNQSQYVLEIFSALCGEKNPRDNNKEGSCNNQKYKYIDFECSTLLPNVLQGKEPKCRKQLYLSSKKYKGLSQRIKDHILNCNNKETFVAYLKKVASSRQFLKLRDAFYISDDVKIDSVFEFIYEIFLEFAHSTDDEVSIFDIAEIANIPLKNKAIYSLLTFEQSKKLHEIITQAIAVGDDSNIRKHPPVGEGDSLLLLTAANVKQMYEIINYAINFNDTKYPSENETSQNIKRIEGLHIIFKDAIFNRKPNGLLSIEEFVNFDLSEDKLEIETLMCVDLFNAYIQKCVVNSGFYLPM